MGTGAREGVPAPLEAVARIAVAADTWIIFRLHSPDWLCHQTRASIGGAGIPACAPPAGS